MTKTEKFVEKSKLMHLDKYDYSNTTYINTYTKVEIICKEHVSFYQKPIYHKEHGCPKCGRLSMKGKKTDSDNTWLKDFIKVHKDIYDYSKVIYVNAKNKVEIICKEHGSFYQKVSDHKSGKGCKKCGELKSRRFKYNILEDFIKVHDDKYIYDKVEYVNTKTKVEIICKEHGSFYQSPSTHRKGSGCPDCKLSKGENKIMNFLKENSIIYNSQYKFNDCLSNSLQKKLSFDFYLPELNICIEYDGVQHFEPIEKWGGIDRFEKQILNDNIKNNYCIFNNIQLIRISYTDFNRIEKVLMESIHTFNSYIQ